MTLTLDPVNNTSLSAIVLPSPELLDWGNQKTPPQVDFRGKLYSTTPNAAHQLRNDLLEIVNDLLKVNISYSGETTVNGSYLVRGAQVKSLHLGIGLYEYRLSCDYLGAQQ